MINLEYQNLINYVDERVKDKAIIKKLITVSLGIALSRHFQLPSSEVEYAEGYYIENLQVPFVQKTAEFNENVIVDIDLAVQTARAFWLQRYNCAYPAKTLPLPMDNTGHFMAAINGNGHLISPSTFDFCQANSKAVVAVVNRIRELISE